MIDKIGLFTFNVMRVCLCAFLLLCIVALTLVAGSIVGQFIIGFFQ